MRTIKFRGKDSKTGNWVYGYYIKRNGLHYISPKHNDINIDRRKWNDGWIEVNPETVGQFTGLYDSTKYGNLGLPEQAIWTLSGNPANEWPGREIYENDVLGHGEGRISLVVWFANASISGWELESLNKIGRMYGNKFENQFIIGNTHDNPELMETEE